MLSASNPMDFDEATRTAYDRFAYDPTVKWWGPAFFTKYVHFLGRGIDRHSCPLIPVERVFRRVPVQERRLIGSSIAAVTEDNVPSSQTFHVRGKGRSRTIF
jgi:hypothetical protein